MSGISCLVTGGTGFIGGHLVEILCRSGFDVTVFARQTSNKQIIGNAGAKIFTGDFKDPDKLVAAAQNKEIIFHIGEPDWSDPLFYIKGCNTIKALCSAALENKDFKRFVLMSTFTASLHPLRTPADEDTPVYDPFSDMYTCSKRYAEEYLARSGLPTTVLRGTFIYGPRSLAFSKAVELASKFRCVGLPFPGRLDIKMPFIHIDDMVEALICAARLTSQNRFAIYNIMDDEPFRMDHFFELLSNRLGFCLKFRPIPIPLLKFLAAIVDTVYFKGKFPNTKSVIKMLNKDMIFSNARMKEELGVKLRYPTVTEGIDSFADWLLDEIASK